MTDSQPLFTGRMREIAALSLPILAMSFIGGLVPFIEKLFFVRLSAEDLEISINVANICRIFQGSCLALALMAQVCVGRLYGSREPQAIGSTIWQFIWFSLGSMVITVPLSLIYGNYYFKNTLFQESALPYFYFLIFINFLYPLGASLSYFFVGRGKTKLILIASTITYSFNLLLAYWLIFGVTDLVPSFGLIGGALSTLISQAAFCIFLFAVFMSKKNQKAFGTHHWQFKPRLFWDSTYPGLLRALNRVSAFLCWTFIAHLMIQKEGDYLLIWSLGSTICLFLLFIGDAICQALTTIVSNSIGAQNFHLLRKIEISGLLIIAVVAALIGIPMVIFPNSTFHILFPDINLAESSLQKASFSLWLYFSFWAISQIPLSRVLAFKDANFFLLSGSLIWITSYVPLYLAVNVFNVPADLSWLVLSISCVADIAVFTWRANRLRNKEILLTT